MAECVLDSPHVYAKLTEKGLFGINNRLCNLDIQDILYSEKSDLVVHKE